MVARILAQEPPAALGARVVTSGALEQDFAALAEEVGPRALSIARSLLGSREAAEDAVQEAFERAFRRLRTFRGDASLSTWFLRIVVNTAHRHGRRRRRLLAFTRVEAPAIERARSGSRTPEQVSEANEIGRRLDQALARLPRRQRTAFVLRYLEGLSTAETAGVMSCAEGTVKAALFRAVGKLRSELEDLLEES